MNARVNKYYSYRRKLYAAGVFTLALLVLLITCPLKRMMQGGVPGTVAAQKFNHVTGHPSAAAYATATSCCALKNKEPLIQGSVIKRTVPSPASLVPYLAAAQGFAVPYFLSRTDHAFPSLTPAASLSLPLFLQHLRLLI